MLQLKKESTLCSMTPLSIYTAYPGTELYETCRSDYRTRFPETLDGWAGYQWQRNNNTFLHKSEVKLLTRLSFASRFFDHKLFERFSDRRLRPLIMTAVNLYSWIVRWRLKTRFFHFMPEVHILKFMQDLYVRSAHRKILGSMRHSDASLYSEMR